MKISMALTVLAGCIGLAGCARRMQMEGTVSVSSVWVCHGNDRQWQRVDAKDGDEHRRHGDRVSNDRQNEGQRCDNNSDRADRRDR
jgi:uncharacterized lipoprotein NlpE involved in copper resistance